MRYAQFPRSGEPVSKLGFGAMGFAGWFGTSDETEWLAAMHHALDRGVSFIDTARAYGDSERIVGQALREWSGPRPFLATKIEALGPKLKWAMPVNVETTFPRGHIRASAERSLKELGVDQVDLMQLHIWWPTWGTAGYWMDELQTLKEQGLARHVGVSIPDHRSDMALPLVQSGRIDSVQTVINIFDPIAFDNLVPACQQHGVAVIGRCTLDEGGLTGTLTVDTAFPPGDYRHVYFDGTVPRSVYLDKVEALREFVPSYASSLAALALKFVTGREGITTALASMHVRAHAEMNIAALDEPELSEEIFHLLRTKHRFIKAFGNVSNWD
jgi:methylglyoxal reductase